MKQNRPLQRLIVLAFLSEILYLVIATIGDLRQTIPVFLLCYGCIFLLYLVAANMFFGAGKPRPAAHSSQPSRGQFRWLNDFLARRTGEQRLTNTEVLVVGVAFGILFRLTLLFTTPTLSDDIYRYVWDGKTAAHGINPYVHAPLAEALADLRDETIYPNINHKEIPTIYPPVTQMVFRGLYALSATVTGFKAGFIIFDLLTIGVLLLILKTLSLNLCRVLIYAWNPLLIIEIAGSGHADIVGIFFLTVALYMLLQRKIVLSILALVLSFLTKFIAILLLPVIALAKRESRAALAFLFIIVSALFYLPYAAAQKQLFSALLTYGATWQFNGSAFSLLLAVFEPLNMELSLLISKGSLAVIFAAVYLFFLMRFNREVPVKGSSPVFELGLIFFGTFILLNPTVHPWYLCWLVPFLAVHPERAWIMLTGLVMLSYWILIDYAGIGVWEESVCIKLMEYVPFYALLVWDAVRRSASKRASEPLG